MAQSFSVEETIHRPASEVWEALTDWKTRISGCRGLTVCRVMGRQKPERY